MQHPPESGTRASAHLAGRTTATVRRKNGTKRRGEGRRGEWEENQECFVLCVTHRMWEEKEMPERGMKQEIPRPLAPSALPASGLALSIFLIH